MRSLWESIRRPSVAYAWWATGFVAGVSLSDFAYGHPGRGVYTAALDVLLVLIGPVNNRIVSNRARKGRTP